ncbi:MAG: hypothetical protein HYS98_00105 [Deltaproteobacteria bacterium]|nr:hypothetical protein [Deltaproteobacteria bacterium]
MAKLVVNLDNVSEVLKKKFDYVLPKDISKDVSKLFDLTAHAQKEGKKRLAEISKKLSGYPLLHVVAVQASSFLTQLPDQSEKVLHFLGIPTLKDYDKLSQKVETLSKKTVKNKGSKIFSEEVHHHSKKS